jgi:uncharacterized membrane protein YccC
MAAKPPLIALADDPRAAGGIRRAKCRAGLAAFALTAVGSYMNGADAFDAGLRALGAGVVGYMVVWAVAVTVWRHIVRADARATVERSLEKRRQREAARAEAAAS